MEKYAVYQNDKEIGRFKTVNNREDEDFLDEFYSMMMMLIPDAGDENLRNKTWSNLDEDLDFSINGHHYKIKHMDRVID